MAKKEFCKAMNCIHHDAWFLDNSDCRYLCYRSSNYPGEVDHLPCRYIDLDGDILESQFGDIRLIAAVLRYIK